MTLRGPGAVIVLAALAISLLVNVFAVSFIAGQWFGNRRIEATAMAPRYPQPIRAAVRRELRENRADVIAALAQLRRARMAMFDAARAPDFNPAALEAAMADVRAATTALQALGQNALAKAIGAASPEDRANIRRPERFNAFGNDKGE